MNRFITIYVCSLALAAGSFAQTPTVSPISSSPTAATTASVTSTASVSPSRLADKIHQKLEKKFHGKHGVIIEGDHDEGDLGFGKSKDIPALVIPLVGIVFLTIFGAPVLIVGLILYFSFSKSRALHRTVRMMVEKGQPVPEALLNPPPAQRQRSDLRRGVVLAMIGIGLIAFFGAASDWEGGAWTLGLIPFLIGAGYLLVWKLDTKKDNPPPVP
ncbi:MAG: DUF6249 domain-containing protein [Candidatus Udaeobacter sp.]